jgi:SAM-dependent methyltransferase
LLVGDATTMPLPAASVGAVLSSHVLHLVPDWRAALREVQRVVRPGGVLLVDFGGGTPGEWDAPARQILERHGIARLRPGVSDPGSVEAALADRASLRPLAPVTMRSPRSPAMDLDEWERQLHAWTWPYSAAQMAAACADIRAFLAGQGWDLEEEADLQRVIQWWAFDLT